MENTNENARAGDTGTEGGIHKSAGDRNYNTLNAAALIANAIAARGCTAGDLACELGISRSHLSNAKAGRFRLSADALERLRRIGGAPTEELAPTTEASGAPKDDTRARRLAEAQRFLTAIDEEAENWCFQTFDDAGERDELARTIHGDIAELFDMLDALNRQGAGVFATVNEVKPGAPRTAANVRRVRACFADFDPPKTEAPPERYSLAPVLEVESSPGRRHVYWAVDGLAVADFEDQQRGIIAALGSDAPIIDLPRVMRVPGFRHMKDPARPHWVRIVATDERLPYKPEDIARAFPPVAKVNGAGGERPRLVAEQIDEGARNSELFHTGRSLRAKGLCDDAVLAALRSENIAKCNPPLPDDEVVQLARSACTKPPGPSAEHDESEWPELYPLASAIDPLPYPVDAFPQRIRDAIEEVHAFVKAPMALVGTSALSALSVALQGHADVERARKLKGPSSVNPLVIADSGERKTTVDGFFTAAIREYEDAKRKELEPEIEEHEAAIASWQAEREGYLTAIKTAAKSGKAGEVRKNKLALEEMEHIKPKPPRVPKLLRGDDTPEKLAWSLAREWPSAGVLSSEAGVIFGAHGMSKDSVMRNLGLLNILWEGGTLDVGRRTGESFTVRGARFTVGLMVQEATLREYFERAGTLARGTGFLARFLIAWPESTQGTRFFSEPPEAWPKLAQFNARLRNILEKPVEIDDEGRLSPSTLTLSAEAKALWVRFHDAIEAELLPSGELYDVRDVASKVADNAARVASLFHQFERGLQQPIGADLMEAAARIVVWHLNESRRFFSELALPSEILAATQLERWLIAHCREHDAGKVRRRIVQQYVTPSSLRRPSTLDGAIATLASYGRARERTEGRQKIIELRPEVLR